MKEAMLEALEEIENGMCRIKERRSIWQNSLVYALCQAVRLLLIDKIKEERRLTEVQKWMLGKSYHIRRKENDYGKECRLQKMQ